MLLRGAASTSIALQGLQQNFFSMHHSEQAVRASNMLSMQCERLELTNDAMATSCSIQVSWRPPSKNSERITFYKLMVATSTGEHHNH